MSVLRHALQRALPTIQMFANGLHLEGLVESLPSVTTTPRLSRFRSSLHRGRFPGKGMFPFVRCLMRQNRCIVGTMKHQMTTLCTWPVRYRLCSSAG